MLHGDWADYSATGFVMVVVSPRRDLIAHGHGCPPSWCTTSAAAAEPWAFHMALASCALAARIQTDCQSLFTTAADGAAEATAASRPLAASSLDGDTASIIKHGSSCGCLRANLSQEGLRGV